MDRVSCKGLGRGHPRLRPDLLSPDLGVDLPEEVRTLPRLLLDRPRRPLGPDVLISVTPVSVELGPVPESPQEGKGGLSRSVEADGERCGRGTRRGSR